MVFPEVEAGRVVGVAREVEGIKVRWKISLLLLRYLKTGASLEEFDSPSASPYISLTQKCKVFFPSQNRCQAVAGAVEGRVGDIGGGGELRIPITDPRHCHLPPASASAPAGTPCPQNPCAGSCSVTSRARAVTMKR